MPHTTPEQFAQHLAETLSDLEFELLLRKRIARAFDLAHAANPNLAESHNYASFIYRSDDESTWNICIGETYSKKADCTGQVFSQTLEDAETMMGRKARNKLSALLIGPAA